MISDNKLLDHDTSDDLTFSKKYTTGGLPQNFFRHLINRLGLSSKERTETVNNNTQFSECYCLDAMYRGGENYLMPLRLSMILADTSTMPARIKLCSLNVPNFCHW